MIENMRFRIARLERFLLDHLGLSRFPEEPDADPEGDKTPTPLAHRVARLDSVVLHLQQEIDALMANNDNVNNEIDKLTTDEAAMEQRVSQNTVDTAHQAQLQQDITGLENVDAPPATTPPPTPAPAPAPAPAPTPPATPGQ